MSTNHTPSPQPGRAPREKPASGGAIKMAVYFKDHQEGQPAKYFWGNRRYPIDKQISRFRNLVTSNPKWRGRVEWAAMYNCGTGRQGPKILEFKREAWHIVTP